MKEYRLMKNDYVTSCVFSTNDILELKNKILQIITENYNTCYYALAGIKKYEEDKYSGAWIDVWEDGKLIQSVDMLKSWEVK